MIDQEGYRANVAMVIANGKGQVFLGERLQPDSWQLPQGGISEGEEPEEAMFRELFEETGLLPNQVSIVFHTDDWLRYELPGKAQYRKNIHCIGQKQIWFLLYLKADDSAFDFEVTETPEFMNWKWVDYWQPLAEIVHFKRNVYKQGLNALFNAHLRLVKSIEQQNV